MAVLQTTLLAIAALQSPEFVATEELRIGTALSEEALSYVSGVGILRDGSIVVGQPLERQVWRFDPNGRLIARLGREGGGPGEFRRLRGLHVAGDSILAGDVNRTFLFHADTLVAVHPNVRLPGDPSLLPSRRAALFADGSFLVVGARLSRDAQQPVPLYRIGTNGAILNRLGVLERSDSLKPGRDRETGLTAYVSSPVHGGDLWAPVPTGPGQVAILRKPIPGTARSAHAALILLGIEGDTVRVLRFSGRPRPVPEGAYDEERDRIVTAAMRGRPFTEQQVRRAIEDGLTRHELQPLFDRLVVASDGTLWLGEGAFGRSHRRWFMYDLAGSPRGRIDLPADAELLAVVGDQLWVLERGEFDEPYIVRLRVSPSS